MARCTAPLAQAALLERLGDRAAFADVYLLASLPTEVPVVTDRVYFVSVDDLQRTREAAKGVRRETYTLNMAVEVHRPAVTLDDVTDQAWLLIDEIEDELWSDPELAAGVFSAELSGIAAAFPVPATDGWMVKASVQIGIEALVDLRG